MAGLTLAAHAEPGVETLLEPVDFLLGPYSSGLTTGTSAIAEANNVLMVEGNGTSDTMFERGVNTAKPMGTVQVQDGQILSPSGYLPRVADAQVSAALASVPIAVIEGVKGCGKTWTGLHHARSRVMLADTAAARHGAEIVPRHVLHGPRPRLVDEWQTVPSIWDTARHVVDEGRENGCFILTGSAQPPDDGTRHSGAGRVQRVRMRPMSLAESGTDGRRRPLAAQGLRGDRRWRTGRAVRRPGD